MKIAVVFGTRPEIIKLSPVIRALAEKKLNFFIVHTNQHYSSNMDEVFLKELNLPKAKYNLRIGSGTHGNMTGRILIEIEKIFFKEKPQILIVQGDTNTALSVALAASKMNIRIVHVEAGLRSYTYIPEETNRVLIDHISDICFTPTKKQQQILQKEGIPNKKIKVVGNSIVDAVFQNLKIAEKKSKVLKTLNLKPKKFIILTTHREENVDNKLNLENILKAANEIAEKNKIQVIFPIHPRTQKMIEKFGLKIPKKIKTIPPIGYLDMLILMGNALIILTDSGGIQEEACILKVPCVTLREKTERPETVEVGGNIVVGTDNKKIVTETAKMLKKKINWRNPFGNGETGKLIAETLAQYKY